MGCKSSSDNKVSRSSRATSVSEQWTPSRSLNELWEEAAHLKEIEEPSTEELNSFWMDVSDWVLHEPGGGNHFARAEILDALDITVRWINDRMTLFHFWFALDNITHFSSPTTKDFFASSHLADAIEATYPLVDTKLAVRYLWGTVCNITQMGRKPCLEKPALHQALAATALYATDKASALNVATAALRIKVPKGYSPLHARFSVLKAAAGGNEPRIRALLEHLARSPLTEAENLSPTRPSPLVSVAPSSVKSRDGT